MTLFIGCTQSHAEGLGKSKDNPITHEEQKYRKPFLKLGVPAQLTRALSNMLVFVSGYFCCMCWYAQNYVAPLDCMPARQVKFPVVLQQQ